MQKYTLKTFKAAFYLVWKGFAAYSAIFLHAINKYTIARNFEYW